jgi:hypothetical protein
VTVEGNTRTGLGQKRFIGRPKDVNYAEVAIAFLFASEVLGRPEFKDVGERVLQYLLQARRR